MKTDWSSSEVQDMANRILPISINGVDVKTAIQGFATLLRSMEEAKAVAYPDGGDREVLNYLMQQFEAETWECENCGHSESTSIMDSADYLRGYLLTHPPAESGEAKDAARYRYLLTCIDADFGPSLVWACDWSREYGSQLIVDSGQSEANFVSAIDAAMTAESREN